MDTVEPGRGIKIQMDGDVIRSDGNTILGADCKGGIAVILEVLETLKEAGVSRRAVEVALSRGEEIGLVGAQQMDYSRLRARSALIMDGGGPPNQITDVAPFSWQYDVDVFGRSAHAGVAPERGVPAIRIAAEVVMGLPQGRLDEGTTGNVGHIQGGQVRNAVPEHCHLQCDMRSQSERKLYAMRHAVEQHIVAVTASHPGVRIESQFGQVYQGYRLDHKNVTVEMITTALREIGREPEFCASGGSTDGNIFQAHGITPVVLGRGSYDQHTTSEYVVITEMVDAARLLETVLKVT
jgi:tripeptide aminopeptidase